MKSLRVFLCLLVAGALMTACKKQSIEEFKLKPTFEEIEKQHKESYAKYLEEHGEIKIEFVTLEILNEHLIENGLPPTSLEKLGVTEAEYDYAQSLINNSNVALSRCSGSWSLHFMDVNANGSVSMTDISLAFQGALHGISSQPAQYQNVLTRFGHVSTYLPTFNSNSNTALTAFDVLQGQKVVLGILPCY